MRTISIFIAGPLPARNEQERVARGHKLAAAALKKRWTDRVCLEVLRQIGRTRPVTNAAFVFTWLEKDRRKDPDNISGGVKYVFDGLIKAGVIENDGWKQVTEIKHEFQIAPDRSKVGVRVQIVGC